MALRSTTTSYVVVASTGDVNQCDRVSVLLLHEDLLMGGLLSKSDVAQRREWERRNPGTAYPGREYGGVGLHCDDVGLIRGSSRAQFVATTLSMTSSGARQLRKVPRMLEVGPCANYFSLPASMGIGRIDTVDVAESVASCSKMPGYRPPTYLDDALDLTKVPSGRYDAVIASHVLEHIVDPLRALRAWTRVLAPGGLLFVLLPDPCYGFMMDRVRVAMPASHYLHEYRTGLHTTPLTP